MIHKKILKYEDFLFEYEGGPPTKDHIKIKSSMITDIDLELEEEDDDDSEINILKHFNEF